MKRAKRKGKAKWKRILKILLLFVLIAAEIALLLAFIAFGSGSYIPVGSEIYLFFRWIDGTDTNALLCFFGGFWALMGLPILIGYLLST